MNKQDIAIVALLVALLFGWMHFQNKNARERAAAWERQQAAIAAENQNAAISAEGAESASFSSGGEGSASGLSSESGAVPRAAEAPASAPAEPEEPALPEETAILDNGELRVVISTKGAAISSATLAGYRQTIEKDSPDLTFNYGETKALGLAGLPGADTDADFTIISSTATSAVFSRTLPGGATLTRSFSLLPDYQIALEESIAAGDTEFAVPETSLSLGSLVRQSRGNTSILSVDNFPAAAPGGKAPKVLHWERKRLLPKLFTGGSSAGGGCAGAPDGAQFPVSASQSSAEPQQWVAIKTRFFANVLAADSAGFTVTANRSLERGPLLVESVAASMRIPAATVPAGQTATRSCRLYIGPKKLSVLRKFAPGSADIMEFGMSKWLCVILLPILNGLNAIFHNYGVAIIVLTIMVRLVFWPLTRKSNESMKKMGAIQPQIKAIQEKFKGDPQKLQQETMKLYRDNHVNPMSSCLPMLIQIPVFIALFVVLRTATELRFAPFLWIRDLSEPENLLAGAIPGVPALNILPFLMAGTMFLQSKLTPSMGDPAQQKMMMWMMPLMMFFMFYSMPSALLLYWSVSQFLAVIQLLRQRKSRQAEAAVAVGADGVIEGEAMTRQERRRREREEGGANQ